MRDILERHGPRTPTARLVVAFVAGILGVGGLVLTLGALVNTGGIAAMLVAIPSVFLTVIAYHLAASVVRRAEEASEPDWWGGRENPESEDVDTDPVTRLQRRYADGELTTEEFERRLDALVESDQVRTGRNGSRDRDVADELGERNRERA